MEQKEPQILSHIYGGTAAERNHLGEFYNL